MDSLQGIRTLTVYFLHILIPGRPSVKLVCSDSIVLEWPKPKTFDNGDYYQIGYRENNETKWKIFKEEFTDERQELQNLKTETEFVFRVRVVHNNLEYPYSEESAHVHTLKSPASKLVKSMVCPDKSQTIPSQYPLKMDQTENNTHTKIRKLELGIPHPRSVVEKTIMMIGETGTGKSTLVDGMANYILGVNWEDPFRLKMVTLEKEEQLKSSDQTVSQTEWITCYTIHPFIGGRLSYSINIIDTPGFGDTRGIAQDQKIVEQIRTLFSSKPPLGVLNIDAVCFLIKAPDVRLTTTQKYIFHSIMSIFGKDIEHNICSLITFADGNEPPVLAALLASGLPFGARFAFNNSALFTKNTNADNLSLSRTFWGMGVDSFRNFFLFLETLPTKSLQLTNDVLFERKRLETTVINLEPLIDVGLVKVNQLRREMAILESHKEMIKDNKNFKYKVKEIRQQKEDLPRGEHVTNCTYCNFTCHKKCSIPSNEDKQRCVAMDQNGNCKICPERCFWNVHANTPYIFTYVDVEVEKTYHEMKKNYEKASGDVLNQTSVLDQMEEAVQYLDVRIQQMMETVKTSNERLARIALRPNPLTMEEYINLMIEDAKLERKPNFMEKIEELNKIKKTARVPEACKTFRYEFLSIKHAKNLLRTNKSCVLL